MPLPYRPALQIALCLLLVTLTAIPMASLRARPAGILPHSVSRSRQFTVFAQDITMRNAVGSLGEDLKAELLRALDLRDDWKLPIVVDLRAPDPGAPDTRPPVRLSMAQTGLGLKIELDLLIGEATLPPPWLVEGFSAYIENGESGVSGGVFAALLPTTEALPISDFLARDPTKMDSTSQAVYRAYAFNLVSLLLDDMEGGRAGMVSFIRDLPKLPSEEARNAGVLSQHFPQLAATPDSLEKWWTIGLAKLASSDRYQAYSVQETEDHLRQLLSVTGPVDPRKPVAKVYQLTDFEAFTPLKQNRQILQPTREGLVLLSGRSNPLCRPIVLGYAAVVESLQHNHTKGVAERLAELAVARSAVLKRREDITDYLNWYEATQVTDPSGAFDAYFRSARQAERSSNAARPDAISAYLDEMNQAFH